MLPDRHLHIELTEDRRVLPLWLTERDDVWLRALVDVAEAIDGRTSADSAERLRESVWPIARAHGVPARIVDGVWTVERRRWKARCASPVEPSRIRERCFALAAHHAPPEAKSLAARDLGMTVADIERFLFADRAKERLLIRPAEPATPRSLRDQYNLALAQTLISRSSELVVTVREHARKVVGYAKLQRLMATFEDLGRDGTRMSLSGALALFHETTKYGRALAGVLGAVVVTAGWGARARVVIGDEPHTFELDATAPLPRTFALPRDADSEVERRLAREMRRLTSEWRITREGTVVRVGQRLFFPDFVLACERGRVLVEIVGFWTPEYLAAKREALRAVTAPMIVCVDERYGPLEGVAGVLPYSKKIDARALLSRAETLLNG